MKQNRQLFLPFSISLIAIILFFSPLDTTAASNSEPSLTSNTDVSQNEPSSSAQQAVEHAWELAYESGRYAFRTDMLQTTEPANRLENAGRNSREHRIYVEGEADRLEKTLTTEMWQAGFEEQAVSVRVENGKTYGRVGLNDWQEVEGYADMFAPAGDPMAFLAGAVNIQLAGEENRTYRQPEGSELSLTFTRYTFEIDSHAFADYIKRDLEASLKSSGQLPQGFQLSAPDQLKNSTGQGEIWINEQGLPSYLAIDLALPRQPNGDEVTAEIQTEFMDYDTERIAAAQTMITEDPAVWFTHRLPTTAAAQKQILSSALLILVFLAVCLWAKHHWGSELIYKTVVSLVITSMVIGPLLQSTKVHAFYEEQLNKQNDLAEQREKTEQNRAGQRALNETDFDPHRNLFDAQSDYALQKEIAAYSPESFLLENYGFSEAANAVTLQSTTTITSTDSDSDGLTDADETYWQSCAYLGAPNFCIGVTDSTDSDGDGLSDGDEVNRLGTQPNKVDTDGDTISADLEVKGFTDSNNTTWYLDPKSSDSNKDGLSDGVECSVWVTTSPTYDATAAC
ncbi:MAG: hypothetical protein KDE51_20675, partial [Anaerolineales bacterium]|nr:hypothetical protein [Anaerolineales bacterium]